MSSQSPSLQVYSPDSTDACVDTMGGTAVDGPALLQLVPPATVRVLHVINGEHYSGAERVQDLLAQGLPDEAVAADLASLKAGKFAEVRRSTCRLTHMPMRGRFDFRVIRRLKQLVRQHNYQILHAHTPRTALVTAIAARRLRLPWVYHVHSPVSRDSDRRLMNWLNSSVERFCLRSATRVVVVSPSLVEYMEQRGVDGQRLACIPNGVPTTKVQRPTSPVGDPMTVGMVALFRPRKGTEVLLEAMSLAAQQGHEIRLRLIGGFETPTYEQQIRQLVANLHLEDRVDFVGFTSQVAEQLTKLDLMVLPSLYGEGLPMVVLEAMAAGVPVVSSRVEGATTAILHRRTGMLVEPSNPTELAATLVEFANGEIDLPAMATTAVERHAEHFSDAAMARGLAALYREVIEETVERLYT